MNKEIKQFCKEYKVKFEKINNKGFVGSWLVDVNAGMKTDLINGKLISIPIKKIQSKRVYYQINRNNDKDFSFSSKIVTNN
jgi:hypothetical protein